MSDNRPAGFHIRPDRHNVIQYWDGSAWTGEPYPQPPYPPRPLTYGQTFQAVAWGVLVGSVAVAVLTMMLLGSMGVFE